MKTQLKTILAIAATSLVLTSCDRLPNSGVGDVNPNTPQPSASAMQTATPSIAPTPEQPVSTPTAAPVVEYVQVERLGRPAINEGLIITNDLLNTWNSVPPTVDLTPAAAPIAAEATVVLKALGNTDAQVSALFNALLPDVMRIDTTRTSGYAGSEAGKLDNLTASLRPIGGRMIKDDVMDITMVVIVPGGAPGAAAIEGLESDNVSYDGPNANGSKHRPLLSEFPYLATPN